MKPFKYTTALFLLVYTSTLLYAQEREIQALTLEKVSGTVYQILGGSGANGGLVIGENSVLVIDSKMDEESVNQTIEAIGELSDKPIRYLVNTHSDGDHIMGNRYFPGSVTVIAHKNCRDDFFKENFGRESDWDQAAFYPFTPSLTFEKNMNIWLGRKKIELHYFGVGHTTGDIIVYIPDEKIAFMGDLYFSARPQLIHSIKNGNSHAYVNTLTAMLESLDAELFLSGHSEPAGREEIGKHIQEMLSKQKKVKELVSQKKTLEEVLSEFNQNEARLISSIYSEITEQASNQTKDNPY